jgi:hypothetical protein
LVQERDVIDIANSVLGGSGLFLDLPDFKIRQMTSVFILPT